MKIVYCILGTFNSGGMERVLTNKANYLARNGHEVTIVTTDQRGREAYFELHPAVSQVDIGINYTENNGKGFVRKLCSYPFKQRAHRQKLSSVLSLLKADICVSMFDKEASFLYKLKDGSSKILEVHFSRYKRLQYGRKGIWKIMDLLENYNDPRIAEKYDRFVVLTEEDKIYWGDLHNIKVIANAHSFEPQASASLEQKRVIAIGRYSYQKGFDDLIEAWAEVYSKHPDWTLEIFGGGELQEAYRSQIERLNLQEVVKLCPPTIDIQQEYLNSSILAMTSRYEGLPMALLEAQVCGLPLVSYACKCGPRDIIENGKNGYLINEGNVKEFSTKLIRLMERSDLRKEMGVASKRKSENFTEETIMKEWLGLFSDLLNTKI